MTSFKTLDEYEIESTQKDAESDDSQKMLQTIIPLDEPPRVEVRYAYAGPSGNFINNPPTFGSSEDIEEELLEKTSAAFSRSRLYNLAIDRLQQAGVPDERIPGILDIIEEEGDIDELVQLVI